MQSGQYWNQTFEINLEKHFNLGFVHNLSFVLFSKIPVFNFYARGLSQWLKHLLMKKQAVKHFSMYNVFMQQETFKRISISVKKVHAFSIEHERRGMFIFEHAGTKSRARPHNAWNDFFEMLKQKSVQAAILKTVQAECLQRKTVAQQMFSKCEFQWGNILLIWSRYS